MNSSINAEIFMKKQLPAFYNVFLLIMLLIICFVFIILNMNYQRVLITSCVIKNINGQFLIMVSVNEEDLKFVVNNNKMQIDDKKFYYIVYGIDDDLYVSDKMKNYKVVYLKVNLDKKYQIDNLVIDAKINMENKMIFNYLKDYLVNGD